MSEENVEIVRRGLERFLATGEVEWETFAEDLEIEDHDIPERGEYQGREGFLRWIEEWAVPWGEWSLEPQEFIDAGDRVIVIAHLTARGAGSGVQVERDDALVYQLRDAMIARLDYFNSREQALQAVRQSGKS